MHVSVFMTLEFRIWNTSPCFLIDRQNAEVQREMDCLSSFGVIRVEAQLSECKLRYVLPFTEDKTLLLLSSKMQAKIQMDQLISFKNHLGLQGTILSQLQLITCNERAEWMKQPLPWGVLCLVPLAHDSKCIVSRLNQT